MHAVRIRRSSATKRRSTCEIERPQVGAEGTFTVGYASERRLASINAAVTTRSCRAALDIDWVSAHLVMHNEHWTKVRLPPVHPSPILQNRRTNAARGFAAAARKRFAGKRAFSPARFVTGCRTRCNDAISECLDNAGQPVTVSGCAAWAQCTAMRGGGGRRCL